MQHRNQLRLSPTIQCTTCSIVYSTHVHVGYLVTMLVIFYEYHYYLQAGILQLKDTLGLGFCPFKRSCPLFRGYKCIVGMQAFGTTNSVL